MNSSKVYLHRLEILLEQLIKLNVSQILLFGIPRRRTKNGDLSSAKRGLIQSSIRKIRENFGNDFTIFSDVCLCQYNTSGQCGIVSDRSGNVVVKRGNSYDNVIDNDKTLQSLGRVSLSLCESGTDFIAPSSMMDGQVLYLRKLLNSHGFGTVKILSYSAKHNSCLYSPFRNNNYLHADFIDKSSYQCSINNKSESIRELLLDIEEGADWIMIKPSLWYMDIIKQARKLVNVPLVVQNVSGEYALLRSLLESEQLYGLSFGINIFDEKKLDPRSDEIGNVRIKPVLRNRGQVQKSKRHIDNIRNPGPFAGNSNPDFALISKFLLSLKRAGADKIITYFLLDIIKNKDNSKLI